jgi:hypothetical protein
MLDLVGLALCYVWLSLIWFGLLVGVCLDELSSLLFFSALVVWFARLSSSLAMAMLYSAFLLMKYMSRHILKKI